ncbi:Protein phosphatase 2C (PP2C)-like domain [Macleaya cordata]|uniref:Protein phosphatase 2C (PP2C)-like domain n=1 Tax=Macleaya cordata TaxID=56857 RepID=A0A200R1M5_MACCD|nr:Protein phosphatase 2C (PP2C)-like domain [Macleaya cordata]
MGNSTSRVVGCFVPLGNGKGGVDLEFLEPLDEGLGHSFCYVRQVILDSPAITPSNSERFTVDSSTLDSETLSGSFRREIVEDPLSLQRPNKNFPETTFKTISGASVSANVSTARTGNQSALFASDTQEPAASFESTSSFAAIPLQPVPRGSGPLNGFMSGPLERGFASGPLERGGGFMSGPIEKGAFMSGPLDSTDKTNFSAPLAYNRRGPGLRRLVRSMSGPMKSALTRTFSRHSMGSGWMQRFFLHPVTQFVWHPKEPKFRPEAPQQCLELGPSEDDYRNTRNLQWAHGKAGEDRVHVVLSEEQGWLFVGIYDGFSGPDAPDFLMNHLYKAIDKELEGLLWDYEDMAVDNPSNSEFLDNGNVGLSECRENDLRDPQSSEVVLHSGLEEPLDLGPVNVQVSNHEIVEEKDEVTERADVLSAGGNGDDPRRKPSVLFTEAFSASPPKLGGQGRRSKRLYELLQMELSDVNGSTPFSGIGKQRESLSDLQPSSEGLYSRKTLPEAQLMSCLVNPKGESSSCSAADASIIGEDVGTAGAESRPGTSFSASGQRHSTKKSLIGSKIRKMYRKQKSLRKKLFPWSYDWHREETRVNERTVEQLGPMRRCKSGLVDHDAVLRAMSRALENTEEAYMDMVEAALDRNPELALMGSCVLVMLMKDQDVYVMNLGDSRVILAQERQSDRHPNPNLVKDDTKHWNRSRESLVRVELDRISEESPIHNQNSRVNKINKSREISLCRLKMRAIQLSTDHSTSVEEEVMRIKAEHLDDNQAILNDRVKGQLKVTRAFGAGFLKEPRCNEALLEMFQIDYIGTAPYISCIPSVRHHRLCSSDRFLVLSSDGLYQYFSNEEVVSHVAWFIENVPEGDPAQYLIAELLFRAAKKNGMDFHELLDIPHGDRRKYHDDVSVMVVSLEGRIWRSSG